MLTELDIMPGANAYYENLKCIPYIITRNIYPTKSK